MRRRSLFAWTLVRLLLVLLAASAFLLVYLSHVSQELRHSYFVERLQLDAVRGRDLILALAGNSFPVDRESSNRVCQQIAKITGGRVTMLDAQGRVVGASFDVTRTTSLSEAPDVQGALAGAITYSMDRRFGEDLALYHAAAPVVIDEEVVGVVRVTQTPMTGGGIWRFILAKAVLPLIVLAGLMVICALFIARKAEEVVDGLTRKMSRFGGGDLEARAGACELDEFLPLSAAFDEMAEILERQLRDLRLEKRQWEAVFTGMREGILAVDHDFNMITLNQAARLSLGLSDDEAIEGRPLFMAIRNANLNHFIHDVFRSREPHREHELEIRTPSGEITIYRLSAVRFMFEEEKPPGVLVVMHDMTRVRRLENMRKEFVANVSHELKTPITAVKGFIETLESCLDDPGQARRFIGIIGQQTDRLNAIIDDLLTLSRLEQADHWVAKDFESKDLSMTVDEAIALCRSTLEARQVTVDQAVPSFTYYANHRLLEQAISNLVENAAKYSPEGAHVTVTFEEDGAGILLRVKDDGPGIPLSHQERIFERFHRVDKSRDRQTGGTGLGLSIVKHIVRVHGGKVTVASKPGEGACFTISLPRRQKNLRD